MWYQHAFVCAKHFANIVPYHLQEGKNLYMKEESSLNFELSLTWICLLQLSSGVFEPAKWCSDEFCKSVRLSEFCLCYIFYPQRGRHCSSELQL